MNRTKFTTQPLAQTKTDFERDLALLFDLEAERERAIAQSNDHKARLAVALTSKLDEIDTERSALNLRIKRYAEAHRDQLFVGPKGKAIKSLFINGLKIGFRQTTPALVLSQPEDDVVAGLIDTVPGNMLGEIVKTSHALIKQAAIKIFRTRWEDLTPNQQTIAHELSVLGAGGISSKEEFFIDRPAPKDGVKQEDDRDA